MRTEAASPPAASLLHSYTAAGEIGGPVRQVAVWQQNHLVHLVHHAGVVVLVLVLVLQVGKVVGGNLIAGILLLVGGLLPESPRQITAQLCQSATTPMHLRSSAVAVSRRRWERNERSQAGAALRRCWRVRQTHRPLGCPSWGCLSTTSGRTRRNRDLLHDRSIGIGIAKPRQISVSQSRFPIMILMSQRWYLPSHPRPSLPWPHPAPPGSRSHPSMPPAA
jgi:hypothetical protein